MEMSDLFGGRNERDYLGEFLDKFTRFAMEQCKEFAQILTAQQRSIGNDPTSGMQRVMPRIVFLHFFQNAYLSKIQLASEIDHIETDLHHLVPLISSSDDSTKRLLFVQLQNHLSNLLDIQFRFKSLTIHRHRYPSTNSSLSNIPQITISTPGQFEQEKIDVGKCWKFANIIPTRFAMSFIASNAREVLCYNNQNHFLHLILITGQSLENIKWHFKPIIDLLWCPLIDRYIAVTHHSIYTIQYNRLKSSNSNPVVVEQILEMEKFHSARIACNANDILFYINRQQSNSIEIYNRHFHRVKLFPTSAQRSDSFCCTNTLIALTEKEDVLVSHFPYVTPKKISVLLFDIETFELRYTVDLNDCSTIYSMKCLEQYNIFFALTEEKMLNIIQIDDQQAVQIAKKPFYTNQTEICVIHDRDLLLINANAGHAIQLIKYRKAKQ